MSNKSHLGKRTLLTVSSKMGGMRLDALLAAAYPGISKTRAKKLVDLGAVYVNDSRVRISSRIPGPGAIVSVAYGAGPLPRIFSLEKKNILFEDSWIIAVNKPPLIYSQPTQAQYKGCIYEAVKSYVTAASGGRNVSIGMPQRLDFDVSGVIVLSLKKEAHGELTNMFRQGNLEKTYMAVCKHLPGYEPHREGFINEPIQKLPGRNRYAVHPHGKRSSTRYRILMSRDGFALVQAQPITGRTHQIRVHLAHAGLAVAGDRIYGASNKDGLTEAGRAMLHAQSIVLSHPVSGAELHIRAPLPEDFLSLMEETGLYVPDEG